MIIDGKAIAADILSRLKTQEKPKKFLAIFVAAGNAAALSFVKQKEKTAKELGVEVRLYELPESFSQDEMRQEVGKIAAHKTCGGILVQLPLSSHINRHAILNAIPREKDVDVLGERALGAFYTGRELVLPPAVATVKEILERQGVELSHLKTAVVGAGLLIGQPVALWLKSRVAELAVFHRTSINFKDGLKEFDLIISGTGVPELFSVADLKPNACVIDFGYGRNKEGELVGDFDARGADEKNIVYTPTPGGTGPILVAKLFENFYTLAR